ncbi:MAG: DUF2059 domain-containing protein [Pseudomonadota bacterium]
MRRLNLILAAALIALTATPTIGLAQEAPRLAKAKQVIEFALPPGKTREMLESLRPMMEQAMSQEAALRGQVLPDGASERLFEIMSEEMESMMTGLKPRLAPVYAQTLTEAELDVLISLYESPEGRSILDKLPLITNRLSEVMATDMQTFTLRVQERFAVEMQARREVGADAESPDANSDGEQDPQ